MRGSVARRPAIQPSSWLPRPARPWRRSPVDGKPRDRATRADRVLRRRRATPTARGAAGRTRGRPPRATPRSGSRGPGGGREPVASSAAPSLMRCAPTTPASSPSSRSAQTQSPPASQPAATSRTKVSASSRRCGDGTVVNRWISASWQIRWIASTSPSSGAVRGRRSVRRPAHPRRSRPTWSYAVASVASATSAALPAFTASRRSSSAGSSSSSSARARTGSNSATTMSRRPFLKSP